MELPAIVTEPGQPPQPAVEFKVTVTPASPYLRPGPYFYPDVDKAREAAMWQAEKHRGSAIVQGPGDESVGRAVYHPRSWPFVQWHPAEVAS